IMRPVPIAAFVIVTTLTSLPLARLLRGTYQHPLDPYPITVALLFASLVIGVVWTVAQVRDRASLPRHAALPAAWSFMSTFAMLVLICSPSIIWERSAYSSVASLSMPDDAELLYDVFVRSNLTPEYGPSQTRWVKLMQSYAPGEGGSWLESGE